MGAARAPQIAAMGGGGFSMADDFADRGGDPDAAHRLDDWAFGLTGMEHPAVCFVPTASGDAEGYVERFHEHVDGRARTSHLLLFHRDETDLRRHVLAQNLVYVGGGSTANLLAVWRTHGLDRIVREALDAGVVLAGVSAGALCWFSGGTTDSFGPYAPLRDGLGFVTGSFCPHYDGEAPRRPGYLAAVRDGVLPAGLAADDDTAVGFRDGRLVEAVTNRPGARVHRVDPCQGATTQVALPTSLL